MELELEGAGLDQKEWMAKYRGSVRTQGAKRIHRPLEHGGRARLPWAGPDCDGGGARQKA